MEKDQHEELLSATQVIEEQPIAERAVAFEHLYQKLLGQLQRSDADE
ncbi:MAG TPA: hypothetical protein VLZ31_06055 [Microbacteriaceae bacterium]|nr:hypothetical protein [Microbacteriaceae bacterium]